MAVMIGQASSDERGKYRGGLAGNQSGRELNIRTWYSRPWDTVIRAKRQEIADKIATAMEKACRNPHIGYDQWQRTTLYTEAKKVGFDLSRVNVPCETDCSALVAVCVNAAGIPVSKDIYTGNEANTLLATGEFTSIKTATYTTSDKYLKRGDILINTRSHTAVALSDGSNAHGQPFTPTTDVSAYKTLRKGDKGAWVLLLQQLLCARGYHVDCDSDFGNDTLAKVKAFQKNRGLVVDGIVGQKTWAALVP